MTEVIIGILGLCAVLLGHLFQKRREFKSKIIEKKRSAYEKFFENFIKKINSLYPNENRDALDLDEQEMIVMSQLLLFAPDKLILMYISWIDDIKKDFNKTKATPSSQNKFGDLMLAIRNDILGKKSKLTVEQVNKLLPMCGEIEKLIKDNKFNAKVSEAYQNRDFDD